jgi:hypothetical protein
MISPYCLIYYENNLKRDLDRESSKIDPEIEITCSLLYLDLAEHKMLMMKNLQD